MELKFKGIKMTHIQKTLIKVNLESQFNQQPTLPLNLIGPRGVGKTSFIKQLATDMEAGLLNVSIPSKTLAYFSGLPDTVESTELSVYSVTGAKSVNETQWSASELIVQANRLATKHGRAILFLDDFHRLNPSTESVMYELLLERKLGDLRLDNNVAIICAMNASKESGGGKLAEPIKNRLQMLFLDFSFDSWFPNFGILLHHWVSSFLKNNRQFILEDESVNVTKIAASPRSWEHLSNTIEAHDPKFAFDNLQLLASQFISAEASQEFLTHVHTMEAIDFPKLIKDNQPIVISDLNPLDEVVYSYIINYAHSIEDGLYIINLVNSNQDANTFLGYLAANIYVKNTQLESGKQITPAQQYILDKLLNRFDSKQKLPAKHKEALIEAEFTDRTDLLAKAVPYIQS